MCKKGATTKGKKAILIVTGVTISAIVLSIGGILAAKTVIIPNLKYNQAMSLLSDGKYIEAECLLEEIMDYKDSSKQYSKAKYEEALALLDEGKDSDDISTLEEAADLFDSVEEYEDSAEKALECRNIIDYEKADQLLDAGDYVGAVIAFQSLGSFSDSEDKMNDAMYEYCIQNGDASDDTTYNYITALEDCNYPGISDLSSSIYQVSASITRVNNNAYDTANNFSFHYENEYIYYHIYVSGLRPGESCSLPYEVEWGDGDIESDTWTNVVNGDWLVVEVGPYHVSPYETCRVYDSEGHLLDSVTVDIY